MINSLINSRITYCYSVFIKEDSKLILSKLDEILSEIDDEEETKRRSTCLKIYEHFKDNYGYA